MCHASTSTVAVLRAEHTEAARGRMPQVRSAAPVGCAHSVMRSFSLLVVSSVVLACGARTSLRDERGGPGGGGVGSTEPATSGSSAHASTSTGNDDCVSRTLDVGGQGAVVLQTDGEVAYFNTEDGRIVRGDLETGEELVLASGKEALGDMAIFDHHLYFSDLHAISRVPLGGGPEELVVDLASTSYAIAVDATGVYWVDGPGTLASHEVKRLTTTGEIVVLASNIQLPAGSPSASTASCSPIRTTGPPRRAPCGSSGSTAGPRRSSPSRSRTLSFRSSATGTSTGSRRPTR